MITDQDGAGRESTIASKTIELDADLSVPKHSRLRINAFWVLTGNGFRLVIQSVYFIIIARSLQVNEYGAFVAVVALAAILSPFVGMGTSNLLIKNVASDEGSFSLSWGRALLTTLATGALALLIVSACRFVLPADIHWAVLFYVSAADLIFGRLSDLVGFAFGAKERFSITAQISVWISLSRLIGLASLTLFLHHPSVEQWALVYLGASFATAAGALSWALLALGMPKLNLENIGAELKEGFFFSVGQSAQSIYNDIDKTMLSKLGDLSSTGIYGAAYRLIDVSMVPLRSVISAAYPGVFRAGKGGIKGAMQYILRMLPKAFLYGLFILLALLVAAPVVPRVLGHEYARTVEALRWLAILPVLKSIHFFLADALTGAGYQRVRTAIQASVAILNVLINIWIIPAYSWRGASWSSIACDGGLGVFLYVAIIVITKREASLAIAG